MGLFDKNKTQTDDSGVTQNAADTSTVGIPVTPPVQEPVVAVPPTVGVGSDVGSSIGSGLATDDIGVAPVSDVSDISTPVPSQETVAQVGASEPDVSVPPAPPSVSPVSPEPVSRTTSVAESPSVVSGVGVGEPGVTSEEVASETPISPLGQTPGVSEADESEDTGGVGSGLASG